MKKHISILGTGWLGLPLAKSFIDRGYHVKGSTTSQQKIAHLSTNGIEPFIIDLMNRSTHSLDFLNSEYCIVNIPTKDVEGFKFFISELEKSNIKKVIFISSTSVYPFQKDPITESNIVKDSPLVTIEQFFAKNQHFKTTIVRFAGLIGYNRKPENFFSENKRIPNPEGFINMIHQDDCIEIIQQIVTQNVWGKTLNACADTHPKRKNYYTELYKRANKKPPIFDQDNPISIKIISNKTLKNTLNYQFKHPDLLDIKEN